MFAFEEETVQETRQRLQLAVQHIDALLDRLPRLGLMPVQQWVEDRELRQMRAHVVRQLSEVHEE